MRLDMKLAVGILAAFLAGTANAKEKERVLPDACGSDKVTFDIKKNKTAAQPGPSADGKSRLVFIQVTAIQGPRYMNFGTSDFTTRFGIDGSWAGAAGNNTYFTIDVPAGEHHLCASVQGGSKAAKEMVSADSFTAEAGKTYYFEFLAQRFGEANNNYYKSDFSRVKEDEGKFRAKALEVSVSTPQK